MPDRDFIERCGEASSKNGFGYETFHKLLNNSWAFLQNNGLDYRIYTGLCLNG